MANDREVLREIWDGKLPICFHLAQEEIMEIQQPDPFYVMVPRLSYFPLVIDKVNLLKQHAISFLYKYCIELGFFSDETSLSPIHITREF